VKYTGPLAALFAKFVSHFDYAVRDFASHAFQLLRLYSPIGAFGNVYVFKVDRLPLFVAGTREYLLAIQAMRQHASQLVWFRWLYVSFSQYMWVNQWMEIKFED
jgi:N-acetylglucosaminylphosphatidylinositol deacetylase